MQKNNLGALIAVNRYYQNISIRTLSDDSGVDIGTISRIENGQIESSKKIENLLEALNIERDIAEKVVKETDNNLNEVINDVVLAKNIQIIEQKVETINQKYLKSCISIDLLLVNLVLCVLKNNKEDIIQYLYILENVENLMSDFELYVYHLFFGVLKRNNSYILDSIHLIELAVKEANSEKLYAYAKYHLTMVYYTGSRLAESLLSLQEAESYFKKSGNLYRIAHCKQLLASITSGLGYYEFASKVCEETIEMYQILGEDQNEIISVIQNKLNILFLNKKYSEFLNEILFLTEEQREILNRREKFVYNKILALYLTENYETCNIVINETQEIVNLDVYRYVICFVKAKMSNDKKANRYLKLAIKEMKQTGHMFNYKFVLQLLAEDLVKEEKYKEACKYYKMISSIR